MALRWRKNKRPSGLAGIGCGVMGSTLNDGQVKYASANALGQYGPQWYWVAGWDSDVPYKNTCYEPCESEEEAKAQAMAYVKASLKSK